MSIAEADQFLARGEYAAARDRLNILLAHEPENSDALMRAIDVHIAMGESTEALQRARQLLSVAPANLDAQFYLAKAEYTVGHFLQAAALIEQLMATPANDSSALHVLRGNILLSQHAFAQAALAFEQASILDSISATAFAGLGIARRRQGDKEAARKALTRAVTLAPADAVIWTELAHSHRMAGAVADAEACFERALAVSPNVAATWFALGQLLAETFKFKRAKQCLERALALQPLHQQADQKTDQQAREQAYEQTISTLGFVLAEMGETESALNILTSNSDKPANVLGAPNISLPRQIRSRLLLPQIYSSTEDLLRWRHRFSSGLEALQNANHDDADIWQISQSNFLLAYQGRNDRDLQAGYAGFLRTLILKRRPEFLELREASGKGRGKVTSNVEGTRKRIRVLFVSSFFRECTVGHYFRSWITDLDPQIFERIVIHTGWQPDEFACALQAQCDQFLLVRGGVLSVAETIRAQVANILIYPEVGMGTMNYLLTNMRLAPIQIAAWGHPMTTGSREIDYFLTCEAMEPPGEFVAAAHYTERLLMLPGIGTRYSMPTVNNFNLTRETFGLSVDSHVYICPQSLFKIHPDNDLIFLDIMLRDEKAVVLFFQSEHRTITQALSQRLSSLMAARGMAPRGQIKFLPRVDAASFRGILSFADVVLDTLHWSGGNTSLDALAAAAPVVTLPGELMRGRQTQAMLRAMGTNELVVAGQEGYVSKAIEVACDSGIRAALSRKIAMDRGAVFDRHEPVKQLAQHLLRLFETGSQ